MGGTVLAPGNVGFLSEARFAFRGMIERDHLPAVGDCRAAVLAWVESKWHIPQNRLPRMNRTDYLGGQPTLVWGFGF